MAEMEMARLWGLVLGDVRAEAGSHDAKACWAPQERSGTYSMMQEAVGTVRGQGGPCTELYSKRIPPHGE